MANTKTNNVSTEQYREDMADVIRVIVDLNNEVTDLRAVVFSLQSEIDALKDTTTRKHNEKVIAEDTKKRSAADNDPFKWVDSKTVAIRSDRYITTSLFYGLVKALKTAGAKYNPETKQYTFSTAKAATEFKKAQAEYRAAHAK